MVAFFPVSRILENLTMPYSLCFLFLDQTQIRGFTNICSRNESIKLDKYTMEQSNWVVGHGVWVGPGIPGQCEGHGGLS